MPLLETVQQVVVRISSKRLLDVGLRQPTARSLISCSVILDCALDPVRLYPRIAQNKSAFIPTRGPVG